MAVSADGRSGTGLGRPADDDGVVAGGPDRSIVDWDEAVRAHNTRVVASVLALAIPLDRAEELVSQAWARLIEKERTGKLEEITLPGLAVKQARFLALTWLRSTRREAGAMPEDLATQSADPERTLIARRDVEAAIRVLATCSRSAQAVFLHLYDDPRPTHGEIARRIGLSVQRVRQIVCEVRAKMRQALERE